jgi:TPR repeat protein
MIEFHSSVNNQETKYDCVNSNKIHNRSNVIGITKAQYNLGVSNHFGKGVEKNLKFAIEWYEKAAENEFVHAQYNIGCCYRDGGIKIQKDFDLAFNWFEKAARQNHLKAQYQLAICYYYGRGTKKNFLLAQEYYNKSIGIIDSNVKEYPDYYYFNEKY